MFGLQFFNNCKRSRTRGKTKTQPIEEIKHKEHNRRTIIHTNYVSLNNTPFLIYLIASIRYYKIKFCIFCNKLISSALCAFRGLCLCKIGLLIDQRLNIISHNNCNIILVRKQDNYTDKHRIIAQI